MLSEHDGEQAVFIGPSGTKLADVLDELAASPSAARLAVSSSDYVELFTAVLAGNVVRPPLRAGLRVRILGLLEARLTESDRVVLGGLVEGTWPPESNTDAWLSRPMRLELGLDLPERRIGLTAHDFAQLLGAREVILTSPPKSPARRRSRRASSSALPLYRAIVGNGRSSAARLMLHVGTRTRSPDGAAGARTGPQPAAARCARPGLSVTEIEHWLRDPYTIYAKHIFRLRPLDPSMPNPVQRRAALSSTLLSASSRKLSARTCPPIRSRSCSRSAENIFPKLRIIPRRERSGGRDLSASRAGLRTGKSNGEAALRRSMPRSGGCMKSSWRKAASGCAASPTASS